MSSQIKNLKSQTIQEKIKHLAILFFSLFLTLAVFSQISVANPKPTSDVGLNKADWLYYKSNNDITAYLGKKSSNLPTVRYQKGADYLEFSMTGVSSTTSVSLETDVKTPNTPTLFYRNIFDGVDANYQITNIPFRVKEEIVLQSIKSIKLKVESQNTNLPPTSFLFSAETSAKPVKQNDGSIAFFDDKGDYLFQLDKPFMYDAKGNRSEEVKMEIKSNETKKRQPATVTRFGGPGRLSFGMDSIFKYLKLPIPTFKNQNRHPMSVLEPQQYTITLIADSEWLNDPNTTYPVIIDPTINHNADANFTGQMNRIADNDSTSSTQLESSYGENANDPYTVLNLHFNEANGTTAGIRDYASTTRVITANANASTTNYVTQLGMGNSASFDGTGDYLTLPDSDDWAFGTTDFSIDLWMRVNDSIGDADVLFSQGPHANTDKQTFYFNDTDSTLHYIVFNSGGSTIIDYIVSWKPVVGNWYHLALVRNGSIFQFYVNGNTQGSSYVNNTAIPNSANPAYVVAAPWNPPTNSNFLNGYLDELRIIKGRALTPEEIKAAASRRPNAVYTSPVLDASASVQWDTLNWTEGGVKTGDGETLYNSSGLVAQWNFNETSGTTADNAQGAASLDGTLTNFASTASQDQAAGTGWTANNKKWGGGALMMESAATADYVSISDPASNALDPGTGDFTIEGFIKSSTAGQDTIIQNNTTVGACAANAGYILIVNGNRNLAAYASDGTTCYVNNLTANASSTEIADGRWHHFAFVTDRDTKAYVYYDGRLATSTAINNTTAANPAATLYMGASGATGDSDFILDSMRFYSRALSASEILSNYNAGNIELQTRTGATSDPNDGTWEAWKPTTGETQLLSMDSDAGNWVYSPFTATGGTITYSGGYTIHTFTSNGTFTPNKAGNVEVLVVAGGGGGGNVNGGGGGGGGLIYNSSYLISGSSIAVTVGAGGAQNTQGSNGVFDTLVAIGGGYGANELGNGGGGGSGGGGSESSGSTTVGGAGTSGQGNNGGGNGGYFAPNYPAGGGGGAGAVGGTAPNANTAGSGGNGLSYSISGASTYYAGGGGGASSGGTAGSGGLGGGGAGSNAEPGTGVAGTANTGGGGGGARGTGGAGGSGIVIIRYPTLTPSIELSTETTLKMEGTGSLKVKMGMASTTAGTVALWHFEETGTTTGTYLYDETANNNDATTTGTTVVDGIFGKARSFNGTSDYLSVPDSANWDILSGDFTVDLWVKRNITSGDMDFVTHFQDSNNFWMIQDKPDESVLKFYIISGGSGIQASIAGLGDTNWHHIAAVKSGSTIKVYKDGVAGTNTTNSTATFNGTLYIGSRNTTTNYLNGWLDELRITKGRALSADEIAETYRMGANHHLTRQVSATDLSAQTKLAFWIAADRPGTGLEAMIGESDYANYELASSTLALSTTTVLYIKGDEIASSTSIKDSSFSGKAITANGNARTSGNGKIGNSLYFDGTGDYLSAPDDASLDFAATDNFTIDFWIKHNAIATNPDYAITKADTTTGGYKIYMDASGDMCFDTDDDATWTPDDSACTSGVDYDNDVWHPVAGVKTGTTKIELFVDGVLVASDSALAASGSLANTNGFYVGMDRDGSSNGWDGQIDEARVVKGTALTADQIRQAYEYGLRSHQITIDFGATLQTSDLISTATDYNFNITATTSGLSATTSGLYLGDKIIIKENLGGTEYTAQGTVNAINTATGAITVPSWDTGSTFPASNGYSPNATVFKWQREYFDITGAATTTRDAITNLTLRPTNGAEGRTIYLDDFRYNTNYLTASSSSAITSGNNRYLQYRTIFSSWDSFVSPYLSAINALYTSTANMFPSLIGVSGGGFLSF